MTKEFEMTDIGLMAYYLGVKVKQLDEGIFSHKKVIRRRSSRSLKWKIAR